MAWKTPKIVEVRLAWKSTCTPAQRASKQPRCDLPGSRSVITFRAAVSGAAATPGICSGSVNRRCSRKPGICFFNPSRTRESLGVIRMPARQRRAVLDDIPAAQRMRRSSRRRAHHCPTQDIEISGIQAFDHEVDGLLAVQAAAGFAVRPWR